MRSPSSKDEEALSAMFRRARTDPDPADLHRVKQQLHALAAQVEAPPRRGTLTALSSVLILVAIGLSPSAWELATSHRSSSPLPDPALVKAQPESKQTKAEPAAPTEPKVTLGVPVAALATVPEEARAAPAEVAPPRPKRAPAPTTSPNPAALVRPDEVASAEATSSRAASTQEQDTASAAREEGEASFLRRAKVSLAGDPARALAMAEEHPSRYPRAVLAQEREVIAIEALSRLGRTSEARARAEAFRSRYPHSAHNGHIDGNIRAPADTNGSSAGSR